MCCQLQREFMSYRCLGEFKEHRRTNQRSRKVKHSRSHMFLQSYRLSQLFSNSQMLHSTPAGKPKHQMHSSNNYWSKPIKLAKGFEARFFSKCTKTTKKFAYQIKHEALFNRWLTLTNFSRNVTIGQIKELILREDHIVLPLDDMQAIANTS